MYFIKSDFGRSRKITKLELQCASLSSTNVTEVCRPSYEVEMTARQPAAPDVKARLECSTKFHLSRNKPKPRHTQQHNMASPISCSYICQVLYYTVKTPN